MASESQEQQQQPRDTLHNVASADATQREAYEYWGYLFKPDKCGTPLLDRLLKGIAEVIVSRGELRRIRSRGPQLISAVAVQNI
jgi:hypothetical protein